MSVVSLRPVLLLAISAMSVPRDVVLTVAAASGDNSVSLGSREEQIAFWEKEIQKLRSRGLQEAERRLNNAKYELEMAKKNSGWFFVSDSDKARIKRLDEVYQRQLNELAVLTKQEELLLAKLKPLYGIVSLRFVQEQRDTIAGVLGTLQSMSYDQAWYSSLFSLREAESFTDMIIGFFIEWLTTYVFMYPFASLYYALWSAPWSIYAYSSMPSDIIIGVLAWAISVSFMLLPLVALVGGMYYLVGRRGLNVSEVLRTLRESNRRNHRQHY